MRCGAMPGVHNEGKGSKETKNFSTNNRMIAADDHTPHSLLFLSFANFPSPFFLFWNETRIKKNEPICLSVVLMEFIRKKTIEALL